MQLHIAIIHGIGKNAPGFSKDLTAGIAREFNRLLTKSLHTREDYASKHLNFIEIVWDDILSENQARLADIFQKEFARRRANEKINLAGWIVTYVLLAGVLSWVVKNPWLITAFVFGGFLLIKTVVEKLRTGIAAEFINDIISYRDPNAKALIQKRIESVLMKLAAPPETVPVTFVAHSLGTVIASDYIWERQKAGKLFDRKLALNNFFTLGSPLALFSLQFGGPDIFTKPIVVQSPQGVWINVYDNDDPIAYPLKCLNDAYDKTVTRDYDINVGWFGIAHLKYWGSPKVHEVIAAKLAADWMQSQQG